jgi:hypothetical protein
VEVTIVKKVVGKVRIIFGDAYLKMVMGRTCAPAQEADKEGGEN